jgi:hypothetical protein
MIKYSANSAPIYEQIKRYLIPHPFTDTDYDQKSLNIGGICVIWTYLGRWLMQG